MRLVKLSSLAMPCAECFSEWMLSKRCYYTSYLSLASSEWQRKKKKETQQSSEVTEPLDDMRHANSFRRAENFGPRIQAARSRRPNANSSVKQWWYAGRGTRERRFYSRRLFLTGCMTFDWRREQRVLYTVRGEVLECTRTLTSASSVITSQSDRKGIKFIIRASDWLYCVQ